MVTMKKLVTLALATAAALAVFAGQGRAQADTLRVCADPNFLPYSNQAREGWENRVAAFVAQSLGDKLEFTWRSQRARGGFEQFLYDTLKAHQCDLVVDVPYASEDVLTTKYYYISSYVFVFKKNRNYDITSMDSPILRTLKLGFEEDTPPEDGLKLRNLLQHAVAFDVGRKDGESPAVILDALRAGRIDVAITWEPAIGYFLNRGYGGFTVLRVPNSRTTGSPEQYAYPMAMGVRPNDKAMQAKLNRLIDDKKGALTAILAGYGVRLYPAGFNPYGANQ